MADERERERDLGEIQEDEAKTLSPIALPIVIGIGLQSLHSSPNFSPHDAVVETRRWRHALCAAAAGFHVSMPLWLWAAAHHRDLPCHT
jgi:hypothetical protein